MPSRYLFLFISLFLLSACSTQPDWLQRKRQYHGWEYSAQQIHDYYFDWQLSGSAAALPVQVFSTSDELWVHWPEQLELPVIVGIGHDGRRQLLSYHRQLPYLVIKDNWSQLQFTVGGEQSYATFRLGE